MSKKILLLFCILPVFTFSGCSSNGSENPEAQTAIVQEKETQEEAIAEEIQETQEAQEAETELEITADDQILHGTELDKLGIDAKTVSEIELPDIAVIHYESLNKDGVCRFTQTGDHLFGGNDELQKVSIPDSYTKISYETFLNCSALTEVTLSEGLEEIGVQAFLGCISLEEITIPSTVTNIGELAFDGCEKLTTVTFAGDSQLNHIGYSIFNDCNSLTSIEYLGIVYESPEAFYDAFGAMEGHTLE